MKNDPPIQFSIVVPFFNEQENIPPLYMRLTEVMDGIGEPYELVFVDDGSKDNTFKVLSDIYEHDRRVNIVRLRRNFGQTAALKRSEEHTSELQSRLHLVCRLLLEKKN